jgi:hypothetical protein
LPSGPSTTIARTSSRDWIPYELLRRYEWTVGSKLPSSGDTDDPSDAYCPAEAPTCQLASTLAAPALRTPASAPAGDQRTPADTNAATTTNLTLIASPRKPCGSTMLAEGDGIVPNSHPLANGEPSKSTPAGL